MRQYQRHFGLVSDPFRVAPDPGLLFWSAPHRAAAVTLEAALAERASSVAMTGAPGTGKTTLLKHVIDTRAPRMHIGYVWHPTVLAEDYFGTLRTKLDLKATSGDEDAAQAEISRHLDHQASVGATIALLVDEAQTLPPDVIERLIVLSDKHDALSLILAGQSGLSETLARLPVRLAGPLVALRALSREETADYVRHRLEQSGGIDDIFTERAHEEIYRRTGGVPRLINALCEKSLFAAATGGHPTVDADFVAAVAEETFEDGVLIAPTVPLPEAPVTEKPEDRREPATDSKKKRAMKLRLVMSQSQDAPSGVAPTDAPPGVAPTDAQSNPASPLPPQAPAADAITPPDAVPQDGEQAAAPEDASSARPSVASRSIKIPVAFLAGAAAGVGLAAVASMVVLDTERASIESPPSLAEPPAEPAQTGASATETAETVAAQAPADPLAAFAATLPADPEDRFRLAVSLATTKPDLALVAYSHAAALGHRRAAYYLGQIYEIGDGVPIDLSLARAWYGVASDELRGARAGLSGLPAAETGALSAPVPLVGLRVGPDRAEVSWKGADGPDAAAYTVEFADAVSADPLQSDVLTVSAKATQVPPQATRWRVIASDVLGTQRQASEWQALLD